MSSIACSEPGLTCSDITQKRSATFQILTPPHGPWPWYDIPDMGREGSQGKNAKKESKLSQTCQWQNYPQAFFPHWSDGQLEKTGLKEDVVASAQDDPDKALILRVVNITNKGKITKMDKPRCIPSPKGNEELYQFWAANAEEERKEDTRVRILIVERLSWEGMQMIGTKYHIGPFFFLTSLHGSPSQYHKKWVDGIGESISIVLPFLRTKKCFESNQACAKSHVHLEGNLTTSFDLLSFYMNITPDTKNNTIVCFHPAHDWRRVYEDNIQHRIEECCEGGPYRDILEKQNHPVFVLLLFFWHLIYAWDQALDSLYPHINRLEEQILRDVDVDGITGRSTRDLRKNAQKLHFIRAELLSYHPYLVELSRSVEFTLDTFGGTEEGAALDSEAVRILKAECRKLTVEIERLDESRITPAERLGNVIDLVFNQGSITMTEAALTDSAAMMQLSVLATIFLPASFVAGVFGISMSQINPQTALIRYLEVTITVTAITMCVYYASRKTYYRLDGQSEPPTALNSWTKGKVDGIKRHLHRKQAANDGSGESIDTRNSLEKV